MKIRLAKNLAINKKSLIVVQSLWNLVKIFTSWVLYVVGISAWLDQNCGFVLHCQVFGQSDFHLITLYVQTKIWALVTLVEITLVGCHYYFRSCFVDRNALSNLVWDPNLSDLEKIRRLLYTLLLINFRGIHLGYSNFKGEGTMEYWQG